MRLRSSISLISTLALTFTLAACGDDGDDTGLDETSSSGDAESTAEATGDGDGDSTGTSTTGDGDGDTTMTTGDGDGDSTTGDGDGDSTTGDGDGDGDGDLPNFENPGPISVSSATGSMTTSNGCDLDYETFTPATKRTEATVFMAHGFQRSIADQAAFAEHVASYGMTVVTVSLCTNGFVGVDHQKNGEAIAQLGAALASGDRVYSGFSAGGLAAFVATAADSGATAFVGLDAVDNGQIGTNAAGSISVPVYAASAEPGQCNTNNNFYPVYAGLSDARVIKVVGAQHFDFEADSCAGLACSFCAPTGGDVHKMALGLITAGAAWATGAYDGASSWWTAGGAAYDANLGAGRIQSIQ